MIRIQLPARVTMMAVCVVVLHTSGVYAQPRDNPIERARHHMELGQEAFAAGDFEAAEQQFVDAYSASPFPAFLYNAGFAAEKAGNKARAAELYRQYLDEEPDAEDTALVEVKIRALLAEAPTELVEGEESPGVPDVQITEVEMKSLISVRTNPADAKIRILNPSGVEVAQFEGPAAQTVVRGTYTVEASHADYRTVQTNITVTPGQVYIVVVEMSQGAFLGFLHVKTDVPGAAIYIDDKSEGQVGTSPWGNVLPTGKHKVWIEKPGYEPIERVVEIDIGDKQEMAMELERLSFGVLHVKANIPEAQVFFNEKPLGAAPLDHQAAPGRHMVLVTADGMKDYKIEVEIARGQTTKLLVRLNKKPSRTRAWVSLGFAVAFFTGDGISGGMALKIHNQLDEAKNEGRLADSDPRITKGFIWALAADVSLGIGAVVSALCLYYFLRDPLPPSDGKVYDPADFDENPDGAADEDAGESLPTETASAGPRFALTPIITPDAAGLGLAIVF